MSRNDIIAWKMLFTDVMSDHVLREYLSGKKLASVHVIVNDDKIIYEKNKTVNIGQYYIDYGKLAHFVSFEIKKKVVYIYDPSYKYGVYRECINHVIKKLTKRYEKKGIKVCFVKKYGVGQIHPEDTFCQTWSFAYLDDTLREYLLQNTEYTNLDCLYSICKAIISKPEFEEVCQENKDWLERNAVEYKLCKKWKQSSFFLDFSRNMSFETFKKLFE